jgi:predicted dehydrogenase
VAAVSTSGRNGHTDLKRAKEFATKWGSDGCVAYNSYDELVSDPDVDVIYSELTPSVLCGSC